MPLIVFVIVIGGLLKKQKIYEQFIEGAKDGIKTVVAILPTLIGLMVGVKILRASGLLEAIGNFIGKATEYIGIPSAIVPVIIVRLFSSSAATSLCLDIFQNSGVDSYVGYMTSIMMSCTETVFYTMSVYYMAAKVNKTRWTLPGALVATAAGVFASVLLANRG